MPRSSNSPERLPNTGMYVKPRFERGSTRPVVSRSSGYQVVTAKARFDNLVSTGIDGLRRSPRQGRECKIGALREFLDRFYRESLADSR